MRKVVEFIFGRSAIGAPANYPEKGHPRVNTVYPEEKVDFNRFIRLAYFNCKQNYFMQNPRS